MNDLDDHEAQRKPRGAQAVLLLSMLLASLGTSIANVGLPALSDAFDAPFPKVKLVVVAYLVSLTATVLVAGRLGDRFGLKPMLLLGLGIFTTSAMLCGMAGTLPQLIAARGAQGIGAAFLMTLSLAMARQIAPPDRVGQAMGLIASASALGTALGPALGGFLMAGFGWHALFLAQAPGGLLAALLAAALLPAATSSAKTPRPSFWIMRNGSQMVGLVLNLTVSAVMMATLVVGPFLLTGPLGLTATAVGMAMAVGPIISTFAGLPSGRFVDRWGPRAAVSLGLLMLATGALGFALLPERMGLTGYILTVAILTPGYQLFQSGNTTATLALAAPEARGTISGLLGLSRNLGLVLGAWGLGAVFSATAGTTELGFAEREGVLRGTRDVFLVAAIAMSGALVLWRRASRTPGQDRAASVP